MKRVCDLDIHKDSVYVCILQENGEKIEEKFGTLTPDLYQMREMICSHVVEVDGMESTSIYWMPIWNLLEEAGFELKLINPYFIRQLPGRKSDVKDAEWIATALQKEIIRGSYVPALHIQEMRQYERGYVNLSKRIMHLEQGIDMQLQRCNIRLSNYISDTVGVSMRKVVKAITQGETRPEILCKLIHARITNKHGKQTITDSLSGTIKQVDIFMLTTVLPEQVCLKLWLFNE